MIIANTKMVLPNKVIDGWISVEDGRIKEIGEGSPERGQPIWDAKGKYLLPGMVDIHGDDLETEISPRPFVRFPVDFALIHLDRKTAAWGITTKLHAICNYEDELKGRDPRRSVEILRALMRLKCRLLVDHHIHARCEIRNGLASVFHALEDSSVKMVSVMDHFPGQGQFKEYEHFRIYYSQAYGLKDSEIEEMVQKKSNLDSKASIMLLLEMARRKNIPIASHDDDTKEKVETIHGWGAGISEFPVTKEAAQRAKELGMRVSMGSPNLIRGKSSTGNLSALSAVEDGLVDILCSDYYPASMIRAPFLLWERGLMSLPQAVKMVSSNPAQALGIDDVGSIEPGKTADLILVDIVEGIPVVNLTMFRGKVVYSNGSMEAGN